MQKAKVELTKMPVDFKTKRSQDEKMRSLQANQNGSLGTEETAQATVAKQQ